MAAPAQPDRALVGECISRAQIEAAGTPDESEVRSAIAACDYERAAMLAIARARTAPLGDLAAAILPGIELPAHPCGSGLKYKKCCADKEVDVTPSPIAGVSWDDFLRGDKMTIEHVQELPLRDLVRVDVARLGDKPLVGAARRLADLREWAHAERAIEEVARRGDKEWEDDVRDWLIHAALECGEVARVRAHVAKLSPELAKHYELELAIADGPAAAWSALVRAAREVVASEDKITDVDFAH